jgi:uncharacterized protein
MTAGAAPRLSVERLRAALGTQRPATVAPSPQRRYDDLEALYPGREIETDFGNCFVVEWSFPIEHRHGHEPLSGALELNDRGAACITRATGQPMPTRPVFFDTETTGLSGGTGTYAFLVGLGTIEQDRVIVRQYLMRDYDEEPAMLEAVSAQLAQHDAIVTYNGKSFDVPLIETRFIASRRSASAIPQAHLDLLYPSRRLLRGLLERCALGDVERHILGFRRVEDLPSWMIPSVFFQFLREGDARLLGGVLEHNRDDILSLLALTGWLGRVYQSPSESGLDARLCTRVARTYESIGRHDLAIRLLDETVASGDSGDSRAEAALHLARLRRGVGDGAAAERMWCVAAEHSILGIEALIAWAKYLEHERRDFRAAREIVERALVRAELRMKIAGRQAPDPLRQVLEHRRARLLRRQCHAGAVAPRM